ncbi:ABC transporter ATP-binding protein [Actinocrinis puniceicyclus]|uniref:ABC transporter ATP-binding protein n=1 Tax=Actinocrinis puniceicyclus TaxID=977794 RepID=A0A8J7WNP9_9ACTN|nr:ABC transporter ATP-binding protein [Actinocrinis puniceicyclus]MBS2963477.1 ABC transporter ATP-binding protein [Actinocrinis puniceicyclus]
MNQSHDSAVADQGQEPVVRVERLTIAYGARTAVSEVSFTVAAGQIVGLVGPNGAGKTSVAETVGGIRDAVAGGSVSVCGLDPLRDRAAVRSLIGMQLQESSFPSRTKVGELCDLYEAIYHAPAAADGLLASYGLADRRRSFISSLSGGMRQRLALVLAQIGAVRLVILDELTTGLDPEQRRGTWRSVRELAERGVAVLLTSHYMDEVEALCSKVVVLREGRTVAYDSPARITVQHGGPATFTVDVGRDGAAREKLDRLGLRRVAAPAPTREGTAVLTGSFPEDYNRIIEAVSAVGLPPSAVTHRAPTFEDAYLGLVAAQEE